MFCSLICITICYSQFCFLILLLFKQIIHFLRKDLFFSCTLHNAISQTFYNDHIVNYWNVEFAVVIIKHPFSSKYLIWALVALL